MDVKICPQCNEHNHVTARSCRRCDQELGSVVITKLPADEPRKEFNDRANLNIEKKTDKEETLLPTFAFRFLLGFLGWFICIGLFLGVVLVIMESMGPLGIILVPFTFIPVLTTILVLILAFLIPKFRARQVPMRKQGMPLGILTAYVFNFLINFVVSMSSDPLWLVGSILGWPFYMIWLGNLFGF